jgi:hypothetical protein
MLRSRGLGRLGLLAVGLVPSSHRITLTLTGALAALAFSAATVHADVEAPTPIGDAFNYTDCCVIGPWGALEDQYYQDFSVPNDPAETFEGLVRFDTPFFGYSGIDSDYNVYVEKDIAGNVPVGEQYNSLNFATEGFSLVYNNIGGTSEAAYITPFGDLNFPTWFVELLGPSFFEPSFYTEAPLSAATLPAAELPGLAADLNPFEDLFGTAGINTWTVGADSSLLSIDPTGALSANLDASVDSFLTAGPANFGEDFTFSALTYFNIDPGAFEPDGGYLFSPGGDLVPLDFNGDLALALDYSVFASGLSSTVDPFVTGLYQLAELPRELLAFLVILGIPFGI